MSKVQFHFQRFEFKYFITADQEAAIRRHIKPYMTADPYAADLPGGCYEVGSLYYDSPAYYYYQQKIDGVRKRKKVRLRVYRNAGVYSDYVFFELKRKYDTVVLKDRCLLTRDDYERFLKDNSFTETSLARAGALTALMEEFESERQLRAIRPVVAMIYDREPYIGKYNPNFRVTFDRHLRAKQNDHLLYRGSDWVDVSGNTRIMELKFNGTLPFYVGDMIKELNLERVAYSKYCAAVEALGSVSPFLTPAPVPMRQLHEEFLAAGRLVLNS